MKNLLTLLFHKHKCLIDPSDAAVPLGVPSVGGFTSRTACCKICKGINTRIASVWSIADAPSLTNWSALLRPIHRALKVLIPWQALSTVSSNIEIRSFAGCTASYETITDAVLWTPSNSPCAIPICTDCIVLFALGTV
jgi:hypothetical protein